MSRAASRNADVRWGSLAGLRRPGHSGSCLIIVVARDGDPLFKRAYLAPSLVKAKAFLLKLSAAAAITAMSSTASANTAASRLGRFVETPVGGEVVRAFVPPPLPPTPPIDILSHQSDGGSHEDDEQDQGPGATLPRGALDGLRADRPSAPAHRRRLDLSFVRPLLAPFYNSQGRPSIDPELMLRMLPIGCFSGIKSGRHLRRHPFQLGLPRFCRLGLDGAMPDHSTCS